MAFLAPALCAGSYGLHKVPEDLESETGSLLIHRPFALMHSCPQFCLPRPDSHGRVHHDYGYGTVRCGALHTPRHSSSASTSGQIQMTIQERGFLLGLTAWNTQLQPTANKHDNPAFNARFSLPNARLAIWP